MSISEAFLKKYAALIVRTGANVRPGQVVQLSVSVELHDFAALVAEECYKAGAREVRVLSEPKPGPASVYVPVVARACAGLGVRETVGLEDAILRSAGRLPAA